MSMLNFRGVKLVDAHLPVFTQFYSFLKNHPVCSKSISRDLHSLVFDGLSYHIEEPIGGVSAFVSPPLP